MKKLCVLFCMMSYILIAGDNLMTDDEIIPATVQLVEDKLRGLAALNQDLPAFLLMIKHFGKAPAQIAAERREQFERLKQGISSVDVRNKNSMAQVDHFLDESLQLFKETPDVLSDEKGKLRIAYTIPHPTGALMYLFMNHNDEK